jgi:hypothetical protein
VVAVGNLMGLVAITVQEKNSGSGWQGL